MIMAEDQSKARGGVATVREVTESLVSKAKENGIILWIVGHVNKEGDVAGPKTLEHLVDTVLVFSMGEDSRLRILQTQKNRFGPSGELALLEMDETGLKEQEDADSYWMRERSNAVPGCALTPIMMGSRIFCVEVQALVVKSYFPSPRRSTTGFDLSRLHLLLAVLEKRLNIAFSQHDVYLNVVGGIKISDPGADLAVTAALISAFLDKPVSMEQVFCGEIGLTGELRSVNAMADRLRAVSQTKKQEWIGAPMKRVPKALSSSLKLNQHERVDEALRTLIN
jgi:DNA repair protein RadA/Sms